MAIFTIDETRWSYHVEGARGAPSLVLLHGFTGCGAVWDEIVAPLHTAFRCITVDLPGHGATQTPHMTKCFHIATVVRSLDHLLDMIGVGRASCWGYSMGGRLALHYAVAMTSRVERLVLESASPGIADLAVRQVRAQSDDALADRIERNGIDVFVDEWAAQPLFETQKALSATKRARLRQLRLRNSARGLAMSLRGMGTGAMHPLLDSLSGLSMPTLVIVGEHDEKFRKIGTSMARDIPDAIYRVVPGAGHAVSWERPAACVPLVQDFLNGDDVPDLMPGQSAGVDRQ